jgi:hypothetical protein
MERIMLNFSFLIIGVSVIGGLYLAMFGLGGYRTITQSANKVSVRQIISIAAYLGGSSSLIFFAIMIFGGVLDKEYMWSFQRLGGSIVISLIVGVIIMLGGAYQIYTTVVFRDLLIRKYKARNEPEDYDSE